MVTNYLVMVECLVDSDSAEEAERIVKERARLTWPPVKETRVLKALDLDEGFELYLYGTGEPCEKCEDENAR